MGRKHVGIFERIAKNKRDEKTLNARIRHGLHYAVMASHTISEARARVWEQLETRPPHVKDWALHKRMENAEEAAHTAYREMLAVCREAGILETEED